MEFDWPTAHDYETASEEAEGGGACKRVCCRGLTVREVLENEPALLEKHRLSIHQWEKVTSHRSWHTSVLALHKRRLVNLDGSARTLGALYRKGFLIQSEFVPYEETQTDSEREAAGKEEAVEISAGEPALPGRPRFFTPRECARLQGFPESFLIDGPNENRWYHQCGNAVCPAVVAKIAQKVVAALQPT